MGRDEGVLFVNYQNYTKKELIKEIERLELQKKIIEEETRANLLHASKLSLLGTHVCGIVHEINNPLAVILCGSELMQETCQNLCKDPRGLGTKNIIANTLSSAKRISTLVNEIKTFACRSKDKELLESVDIHQCIKDAIIFFDLINKNENIKIETELMASNYLIKANAEKIKQVMINLLANAKYALINKVNNDGVIKITTSEKNENLLIEVSDNGIGIPEEFIPKIFDSFFTTRPPEEGTGLGLSICYSLVTSFGGTISVTSKVGPGTTFKISFPQKKI